MPLYRLEVFLPPGETLGFRRFPVEASDEKAIKWADDFCRRLTEDPNVKLARYVLYEDERVVRERRLTAH